MNLTRVFSVNSAKHRPCPASGLSFPRLLILCTALLLFSAPKAWADETVRHDWYWFFYEEEAAGNRDSLTFRPFFLQTREGNSLFQASLMPGIFWRYKTETKDEIKALFGFVQSTGHIGDTGLKEYDLAVFPFLFFGTSKDPKDRYALVWPFGGTLKGKFGYNQIQACIFPGLLLFVFFPQLTVFCNPTFLAAVHTFVFLALSYVPVYARFDQGDYRAHSLFWPLIMWGSGTGRKDIRVLPFYSHLSKEGFYDRYNILIIVNYQKLYYPDDTHYSFFLLPLFGRKWSDSGDMSAYTLLWPLFSWGYDRKRGEREYNLPWPLVQIRDCEKPKVYKRIFFPFYGDYRFEQDRTFFVTPLYFMMTKKSARFDSEYYFCGVIFWYFKRKYHGEPHEYYGNSWRYCKLWPLFQHEENDRGDVRFNMLSLLPFRDDEGYERLYQPLWTLLEYRVIGGAERRIGFLFRLFYHRFSGEYNQVKIPFVITYDERKKTIVECSGLLSMFGYNHNRRGKFIRLFWIPVKIGEPDEEAVNDAMSVGGLGDDSGSTEHITDASWVQAREMGAGSVFVTWNVF